MIKKIARVASVVAFVALGTAPPLAVADADSEPYECVSTHASAIDIATEVANVQVPFVCSAGAHRSLVLTSLYLAQDREWRECGVDGHHGRTYAYWTFETPDGQKLTTPVVEFYGTARSDIGYPATYYQAYKRTFGSFGAWKLSTSNCALHGDTVAFAENLFFQGRLESRRTDTAAALRARGGSRG